MEPAKKPLRSQPTRDRILAAAREAFARDGYERATIRGIAETAQINPSMAMRYYVSKEALFAQVTSLDFQGGYPTDVPRGELGEALVRHVMGRWEDPGSAMAALLRASFSHDLAQARVAQLFGEQIGWLFKQLGIAERSPETAPLVAIQMIGLGIGRYVLQLPAAVALPQELVIARVGRVVQSYVDEALAGSEAQAKLLSR